jgi:hypothetical protein
MHIVAGISDEIIHIRTTSQTGGVLVIMKLHVSEIS